MKYMIESNSVPGVYYSCAYGYVDKENGDSFTLEEKQFFCTLPSNVYGHWVPVNEELKESRILLTENECF